MARVKKTKGIRNQHGKQLKIIQNGYLNFFDENKYNYQCEDVGNRNRNPPPMQITMDEITQTMRGIYLIIKNNTRIRRKKTEKKSTNLTPVKKDKNGRSKHFQREKRDPMPESLPKQKRKFSIINNSIKMWDGI